MFTILSLLGYGFVCTTRYVLSYSRTRSDDKSSPLSGRSSVILNEDNRSRRISDRERQSLSISRQFYVSEYAHEARLEGSGTRESKSDDRSPEDDLLALSRLTVRLQVSDDSCEAPRQHGCTSEVSLRI
jgi:hypothetical protein